MRATSPGDLLREVRLRHGLSQEVLAIRAGTDRTVISAIESGVLSPRVSALAELVELLGEELLLGADRRLTGIDLTLNSGNLELTPDQRVAKGLAFADLVRENRPRGAADLGRPLRPAPIFRALICHGVDFVVIGSIAGLVHGSAYHRSEGPRNRELRAATTGRSHRVPSDFRVMVASLDHLIAMKRASGKRRDRLMLMEYVELADEIRRREAEEGG